MKEQVEKITDLDLDREQYYTLQDTPKFSCLKLIERKIVYSATSSTETALIIFQKDAKLLFGELLSCLTISSSSSSWGSVH